MFPKTKYILGLFLLLAALEAKAQGVLTDDNTISVYAQACETIRTGEARSGARIRATDKAGFKAVETIGALSDKRSSLSAHDFNVLVYHLIDNYLEDMTVRTIEQNDERICVEVTGYLAPKNINRAQAATQRNKQALAAEEEAFENEEDVFLELEDRPEDLPEVVSAMPPKPQPKIRKEISFSRDDETEFAPDVEDNSLIKVFVDKTKFYNGTESGGFFADIEQSLSENPDIEASTSKTGADYILKTTVLRAKVDPINQKTFRLQMVVQLELMNTESKAIITEHQNRFILFESSDDEQKVALNLMRKLLRKGCRQLLPKIKSKNLLREEKAKAIITPPKNR